MSLTDERIRKVWCICTMEYYPVTKNNEILAFAATRMDPEIVILSEVRQRKQILYAITYMWSFL